MTNKIAYQREFSEEAYSRTVDSLNTVLNDLGTGNMGGQVIELSLPIGGGEVRLSHNLKITPKYRIILGMNKSCIISDGQSIWNEKFIYLEAKSSTDTGDVAVKVLLLKG